MGLLFPVHSLVTVYVYTFHITDNIYETYDWHLLYSATVAILTICNAGKALH